MSNKGMRLVWNDKKMEFEVGRAAPQLLPEHLRSLPGELVTKEVADGDKVHEYDPPHVAETILADAKEREEKAGTPQSLEDAAGINKDPLYHGDRTLDQYKVDMVRMRVIAARITSAQLIMERSGKLDPLLPKHLWFPQDNVDIYELRDGNAPAPQERPRHLRRLDLTVDPFNWPPRILDMLRKAGYPQITHGDLKAWKQNYERYVSMESEMQASTPKDISSV